MAAKKTSRKDTGRNVSSGTLIASVIAAFFIGYVVSAFVGGFRIGSGSPGRSSGPRAAAPIFKEAPVRVEYLAELEAKTSANPGSEALWTELGNAYFDSDQFLKAIDAYQRSLQINPKNPNVWTDMGIMYRRLGEHGEAVAAFDRAAREDPSHLQSHFNKGTVLFYDLNDRVGAFQAWEELARMNPNFRTPTGKTIVQMMRELR